MTNLNRVHLIGQLGFDPELRELSTDPVRLVARMSVATNEPYTKADGTQNTDTQWHTCVAWGQTAHICRDLRKGQRVDVEGRLVHRSYKGKDGVTKYLTEIVVTSIKSV